MFERITPENAGISSKLVKRYIDKLNQRNIKMHSTLMIKGDKIFSECYWKPFNADFNHRMYSETKSFVSIAIGLLIDDGKLGLNDKVASYFEDKIDAPLPELIKNQTVEQMLMMTTVGAQTAWFINPNPDRVALYFANRDKVRAPGTIWAYDSAGSQVLCELVERISGMRLFDFLYERIFKHLGTFKNARLLSTKNGASWGDSSMLCTTRDMASFARFVMNLGTWNGKRLLSEEYLKKATSKMADNMTTPHEGPLYVGYGYQIWRVQGDGFAFVGMGDELTLCFPSYDVIFVCTADNQGSEFSRDYIVTNFIDIILDNMANEPILENKNEYSELLATEGSCELFALKSSIVDSPLRDKINGVKFVCDENPMGIRDFTFHFKNKETGELHYTNENGHLVLPFNVNSNCFDKFPELGYSQDFGGLRTTDGSKYDCATSLAWKQENKILIYVQIIDRYFGNASLSFAFNGDDAFLSFDRVAEDFLWNYKGVAIAKKA